MAYNTQKIIFSISGVRGVAGKTLTKEVAKSLAEAFGAQVVGGSLIVGGDTRPSTGEIQSAVCAGLNSVGCSVIDAGVAPTPSIIYALRHLKLDGGIVVSASHNPPEWNGLKFISKRGTILFEDELNKLKKSFTRKRLRKTDKPAVIQLTRFDAAKLHLEAILSFVDSETIRKAGLNVAIDACLGAGAAVTPHLLQRLGCRVLALNCIDSMTTQSGWMPIDKSAEKLSHLVVEAGLDAGFLHDFDADRLICVTENGEVVREDYSLALIVDDVLKRRSGGVVVTNIASSLVFDHIAEKHGAKVVRTRVGEINVVRRMMDLKATVGGEGSCGGIIIPEFQYTRDGPLASAKIVEIMSRSGRKISEILEEFPKYFLCKTEVPCSVDKYASVTRRLEEMFRGVKLDLIDGVKIHGRNEWVLVRPSNTEPLIRVMAEAESQSRAQELCCSHEKTVREALSQ